MDRVHANAASFFWQPLTLDLPKVSRSYCTRPEWSTPSESAWMRLAKFSWCNRLTLNQLMQLFAKSPADALSYGADMRRADRISDKHFNETLGLTSTSLQFGFCVDKQHHLLRLADTECRYCPTCFSNGFHASIFQWRFVTRCPIHRIPLRTGCPQCRLSIPYRLGAPLADSPLQCVGCRVNWLPCLARPAGQCSPLKTSEVAVLEQWARYITHVIGPAGSRETPGINPRTGRFSAARTRAKRAQNLKQLAYLSTLSRLYPTPPPMPMALRRTEPCAENNRISYVAMDAKLALSPTWPRGQWQRFNAGFIALESVLNDTQESQLGSVARRKGNIDFNFNDPCINPADRMTSADAATLGWCMSWYGYHRPQSIFEPRAFPALGLAAWLAHLPDRPRRTGNSEWLDCVAEWLRADLVASWQAWHDIAVFMQAHGTYFLHPALAKPADFARMEQKQ
jgi:hypothetical protein